MIFKRMTMAKAFDQLSVHLTTNVSCQLKFWVFVTYQLFYFLAIVQLSLNPIQTNAVKCLVLFI